MSCIHRLLTFVDLPPTMSSSAMPQDIIISQIDGRKEVKKANEKKNPTDFNEKKVKEMQKRNMT